MTHRRVSPSPMHDTETANGRIPHEIHPFGFRMPVALRTVQVWDEKRRDYETSLVKNLHGLPYPEVNAMNEYVYALPGGGRYIPKNRIFYAAKK
jgi:hypothetical protein